MAVKTVVVKSNYSYTQYDEREGQNFPDYYHR